MPPQADLFDAVDLPDADWCLVAFRAACLEAGAGIDARGSGSALRCSRPALKSDTVAAVPVLG